MLRIEGWFYILVKSFSSDRLFILLLNCSPCKRNILALPHLSSVIHFGDSRGRQEYGRDRKEGGGVEEREKLQNHLRDSNAKKAIASVTGIGINSRGYSLYQTY